VKIYFYKYEGAGNDFIIIDNREKEIAFSKNQIKFLCDRHFGIGSDGLMLLTQKPETDFNMEFFNPDGSGGMMCGNGGRCVVRFAKDRGIITKDTTCFMAPDGKHEAEILDENIALKMKDVKEVEKFSDGYYLNTGTSHFVKKVDDVNKEDVLKNGRLIRWDARFSKYDGCNANFYTELKDKELLIRTYERGVENETLACGTGIVATAIVYGVDKDYKDGQYNIKVKTKDNDLKVSYKKTDNHFTDVVLIGPANKVYEGYIEI
jgi:diaminopimelate epimerase